MTDKPYDMRKRLCVNFAFISDRHEGKMRERKLIEVLLSIFLRKILERQILKVDVKRELRSLAAFVELRQTTIFL